MRVTMKITVIDGQGGRIGKSIIEQIKKKHSELELYAIGTNSIATSAMLKAGNALLGEITPSIASAIGASKAYKILIPVNRCNHFVAGCVEAPMGEYIRIAMEKIESML